MSPITLSTKRLDQTVHHAVLDNDQLKAIVLEAVSKAAGVTVDRRAVCVDRLYLSSEMRSTGTEYRATCTLVVDHAPQPDLPGDASIPA